MIAGLDIEKSYGNLQVLRGVSFEVKKSEIVAIVGPSGAGKSTLLHIIGTLDHADKGSVSIEGINPKLLSNRELAHFRNEHIGFIFQFHHLLPEFTALENVMIPGFIGNKAKSELQDRAVFLLSELGLKDRIDHKPAQLSGGEQQRVAVARALINQPTVVLADEPSGNLDTANARELHNLFFDLRAKFGQTFIIVTHNDELASMVDRKLIMRDGRIVESFSSTKSIENTL
jgi:lipoprotein-releasing system ATP-binding protein